MNGFTIENIFNISSKIEENLRLDGYVAQIIFNDAKKAIKKL